MDNRRMPLRLLSGFGNTGGGAAIGYPNLGYGTSKLSDLMRSPSQSEMGFFQRSPNVGGYASPDNRVVINPTTNLSPMEKAAVAKNEQMRIFLRQNQDAAPGFAITPEQTMLLQGTSYRNAPIETQRETVAGRIYSGDPSAGNVTQEQSDYIRALRKRIESE